RHRRWLADNPELELEPRSELHLERRTRIVAQQEIAESRRSQVLISNLQEVRVCRPKESTVRIDCRVSRAEGSRCACKRDVLKVEDIEHIDREHQPLRFRKVEVLGTVHVKAVEG